jgi:hypothetical protein
MIARVCLWSDLGLRRGWGTICCLQAARDASTPSRSISSSRDSWMAPVPSASSRRVSRQQQNCPEERFFPRSVSAHGLGLPGWVVSVLPTQGCLSSRRTTSLRSAFTHGRHKKNRPEGRLFRWLRKGEPRRTGLILDDYRIPLRQPRLLFGGHYTSAGDAGDGATCSARRSS